MKPSWEDLVARSRGLATHLLTPARLASLAAATDLDALAQGLRESGLDVGDGPAAPEQLERAVRRAAARQFRVLERWSGPRVEPLALIFEDEDRRSLRAILRGAVQGVGAEQRLAGLVPTPALPERVLLELARQPTVNAVAALLSAWRNPYGPALRTETSSPHPDLLRIEAALTRAFAERALRSARRRGSRTLAAQVRQVVDLENALTAVMLAGPDRSVTPRDLFLPSGDRVTIDVFERAVAAGDYAGAAEQLARAFEGTPFAAALREAGTEPADLERALLEARIVSLRARARIEPLDVAAVLLWALGLRAQVMDLCRVIWGVALGAPPALRLARGAA